MMVYLTNLAIKLDMERPTWREDSVVLLDGARPHIAEQTVNHIVNKLKMPVIFTAPYSYDAAPCELFFAYFKND